MRVLRLMLALALLTWSAEGQAPNYFQFVQAFDQAQQASDAVAMEAVVRTSPDLAVFHFVALSWERRQDPQDDRTPIPTTPTFACGRSARST